MNGAHVQRDVYYADAIIKEWLRITGNRGRGHNCNQKKAEYRECGIGMVGHADKTKRCYLKSPCLSDQIRASRQAESQGASYLLQRQLAQARHCTRQTACEGGTELDYLTPASNRCFTYRSSDFI